MLALELKEARKEIKQLNNSNLTHEDTIMHKEIQGFISRRY